jgi:DNA modification methylase
VNGLTILTGDARQKLKTLPDSSVHCCVTSPPYWGLRDYGTESQIGKEATPSIFVDEMVAVFSEVRRVLREDGTCWLNLGDSYCNFRSAGYPAQTVHGGQQRGKDANRKRGVHGLKEKDLIGIPWRVAFALQADGWWLRGDHVWAKPNGMPESVTDRPTRSHEYVFLLTKSERYWYDSEAVRTAPKPSTVTRLSQDVEAQAGSARANGGGKTNGTMKAVKKSDKQRGHTRRHAGFNDRWDAMERDEQIENGANLRSVWWIPPAQCKESHFAVMPERVAEICIRAGCPEGGIVLDPFLGSGTTAYVARNLGRQCVGIELNPEYVKIAKKRNAQQVIL